MRGLLRAFGKQIVRVFSFFFKEIWATVRQPRLIFSVVLGPFLILAAFGVGYRGQTPELRTTLVIPDDPRLPEDPAAYRELFSQVFVLERVTRDRRAAEAALARQDTEVVVVVPEDAEQAVRAGQHAEFEVLFRETDPLQAAWVRYFATVAVQELNRRVVADLVGNGQEPAQRAVTVATDLRVQADALDADLRAGNALGAAARVVATRQALATARTSPAFSTVTAIAGERADPLVAAEADLAAIEADLARGQVNTPEQLARSARLRQTAAGVESEAQALASIPPDVLSAPFSVRSANEVPIEPTAIGFFAPAVVALLLQHIAVSLASLSMVRDRLLGAMEIYRVAPIGPLEVILGKSLSFGLLLGLVGGALFLLIRFGLGVPLLGDPRWAAVTIALLLFSSLGLGFFLSALASTETQAVQLAMLVLLCSIFFGGFFLPLESLQPWLRSVGYALPVTFGSLDLREVMLRGVAPEPLTLAALAGVGVVCYALASFSFSRQMATQ
jgi:ABC-2 type transport system permease protein